MQAPRLHEFQFDVLRVSGCLNHFLNGGRNYNLSTAFKSITEFKTLTVGHVKALLPLGELIGITWRRARLPGSGTGRVPLTATPAADGAFCIAAYILPAMSPHFDLTRMFDEDQWAPGERLRALAPLTALLEYGANASGLNALPLDAEQTPEDILTIGDAIYSGRETAIIAVLDAVSVARTLEAKIQQAEAAGGAPRELLAVSRAVLSSTKIDAAAWGLVRALGRAPPGVGDLSKRVMALQLFERFEGFKKSTNIDGVAVRRGEVPATLVACSVDTAQLLVSLAAVVAERPAELGDVAIGSKEMHDTMALAYHVAASVHRNGVTEALDVIATPKAQAALAALATTSREIALAFDDAEVTALWFCTAILGVHPPHSLVAEEGDVAPPAAVFEALKESSDAFNFYISSSDIESRDLKIELAVLLTGTLRYITIGVLGFPAKKDAPSEDLLNYLVVARKSAPFHAAALSALRSFLAAVPYVNTLIVSVLTLFHTHNHLLPISYTVGVENAEAARNASLDFMKFMLSKIPPSMERFEHFTCAWFCCSAFSDACFTTRMLVDNRGDGDFVVQRAERALAGAALKFLHLVGQEHAVMKAVFSRSETVPRTGGFITSDLIAQACGVIATALAALQPVLAPALTAADATGMQAFCEMGTHSGVSWGIMGRVAALASAAAAADQHDEARAKARARLLSELDCAYLGCSKVRPEGSRANKLCAGCGCVRYCSREDQRADWSSHRLACKGIQAEKNA